MLLLGLVDKLWLSCVYDVFWAGGLWSQVTNSWCFICICGRHLQRWLLQLLLLKWRNLVLVSLVIVSVTSLLWCTKSNVWNVMFFYVGETDQMLSKSMNGHQSTCTIVNSNLLVPIHTKSHQLQFQECWSIRVIYKLPVTPPWSCLPSIWNCVLIHLLCSDRERHLWLWKHFS